MHLHKAYMYIDFQQNRVCIDQSKPCTQIYLHNIAICINLQLPIVILKKKILLDMHHHKTCWYINFQQNQVKTHVMTVHTSLFANNRKLYKFATTNNNFFSSTHLEIHYRKTYMHINFQQNRVKRSVKTVHTNIFAKNRKLHKFATTNSNFEKIYSFRHASS